MNNKTTSILFCGIGGQGILKAADVAGWAALFSGYHTKTAEVHGMSQRGGSVESYVRFGRQVFSPLIPKHAVDFLVPLNEEEQKRFTDTLGPQSIDLLPYLIAGRKKIDNVYFLNTYMLGVLSAYLDIPEENWLKALQKNIPAKALADNITMFQLGRKDKK
jgi:indolepyruvate ferredoxin oxidoreductase beta subunit